MRKGFGQAPAWVVSLFLLSVSAIAWAEGMAGLQLVCLDDNSGAKIFVDGSPKGVCEEGSMRLFVESGKHKLLAEKPEGDDQIRRFTVNLDLYDGEIKRITVNLGKAELTPEGKIRQQARQAAADMVAKQEALRKDVEGANAGDIASIENMIRRYQTGDMVAKDEKRVANLQQYLQEKKQENVLNEVRAVQASAEAGNLSSIQKMIGFYQNGYGVEKDPEMVKYWEAKVENNKKTKIIEKKIKDIDYFFVYKKIGVATMQEMDESMVIFGSITLPLFVASTVTDLVIMPFKAARYTYLKKQLKAHAAYFAEPDSLMATYYQHSAH